MKKVFLADMDGTLTSARRPIEDSMAELLIKLSKKFQIGIVSGSGMPYIDEQLGKLLQPRAEKMSFLENLLLLPCNGTQLYRWHKDHFFCASKVEMREKLGDRGHRLLVRSILQLQCELIDQCPEMKLTGHFISDRGSMVNWAPVGREADEETRRRFVELDHAYGIRPRFKRRLEELLIEVYGVEGLEIVLGGQTSFDIYPRGWDKTYALTHFPEGSAEFWFIGDKCGDEGNDRALYERVRQTHADTQRAFWVSGPKQAQEVIKNLL